MSQLTEEQVKAINDVLIATGEDQFEIGIFISRVQEKLKPLPSYGEIAKNAYNETTGEEHHWWAGVAQAVRRAFIEREVKPVVVAFMDCTQLEIGHILNYQDVYADLKKLIKVGE